MRELSRKYQLPSGTRKRHQGSNPRRRDRRRQAEIENLRRDVGRKERESRSRELLRQHGAQLLDVIRRWRVIFVQADQGVAVLGADRAGVLVGRIDTGNRQTKVVDESMS